MGTKPFGYLFANKSFFVGSFFAVFAIFGAEFSEFAWFMREISIRNIRSNSLICTSNCTIYACFPLNDSMSIFRWWIKFFINCRKFDRDHGEVYFIKIQCWLMFYESTKKPKWWNFCSLKWKHRKIEIYLHKIHAE